MSQHPRHQGFSLTEVLVALLLGLIIMLALYVTLITNLHSLSTTEAQGALSDNSRRAVYFIQQQLKQAGYRSFERNVQDIENSYFLPNGWSGGWADSEIVRITQGASNDQLLIRYYGETNGSQIGIQDCDGGGLAQDEALEIRISVNNKQQLTCEHHRQNAVGSWSTPRVIADGIESLQLRYSQIPTANDPNPSNLSYRTADPADWSDVGRVQFAILARSTELTASGIKNDLTYTVLDKSITAGGDRFLRAVHERSVTLRNIRLN